MSTWRLCKGYSVRRKVTSRPHLGQVSMFVACNIAGHSRDTVEVELLFEPQPRHDLGRQIVGRVHVVFTSASTMLFQVTTKGTLRLVRDSSTSSGSSTPQGGAHSLALFRRHLALVRAVEELAVEELDGDDSEDELERSPDINSVMPSCGPYNRFQYNDFLSIALRT